jgi:RNA polymerase sigma-70 factor (ECF subfamily)
MILGSLAARVADHLLEFRPAGDNEHAPRQHARPRPNRHPSSSDNQIASRAEQDRVLVQRVRAGDEAALESLIRAYSVWLIDTAAPVVGSADLAQDVVQEVFIRIWDNRARLEIHGSVAAYLYRAVRNRATNLHAHERAERTLRTRLEHEQGSDAERNIDPQAREAAAQEFERAVEQALAALSPKLREVFLLRVDQGLSSAEIAGVLGIAVASVHKQMYRATKTLAETLAEWLIPEAW